MDLFGTDGVLYLLRWIHFLAGIIWIGLLYYFNFVQGPFFAETDAATKNNATAKLVPRALWWFRWGAMFTFLSGLSMLIGLYQMSPTSYLTSQPTKSILIGALLGTLMFLNVWLVIWPKQKIVIASTQALLGGGQANPAAAGAGRRAFLASRTNTMFSIPMLFFMGAGWHFPKIGIPSNSALMLIAALVLVLEVNSLVGTTGPLKKPLEKVSGVITSGFVLFVVLFAMAHG